MENQEKNFKKFTKILDNFANKTKHQGSLYRKCQEFKTRGELSIKLLKEKKETQDMVQTQRRLPVNPQLSVQTLPPPPASKRSSKSSITYCDSPRSAHRDKSEVHKIVGPTKETEFKNTHFQKVQCIAEFPVRMEVTKFECIAVVGNKKSPPKSAELPEQPQQGKPESSKSSNSVSLRASSSQAARFTEKWKEPTMQLQTPAQAVFKQFEYTAIDRKLKTMQNPFKKPPDLVFNSDLLEKSLEEKLSNLLPQIQNPNTPAVVLETPISPKQVFDTGISPSINIRHLSQGSQFASSELEEGTALRESLTSQILIKDEIVSRFRDGEEEQSTDKKSKPSQDKLESSQNNSPSKEQDSTDLMKLNSPHPEEALANISPIPFVQHKKTVMEKPAIEAVEKEPEEAKSCESIIDFSTLTNEDKSYAIADFILENLLLEVFTSSLHVKERLVNSFRKIISFKSLHSVNEMSRYLSQIFTLINDSPEEQLDIFMKLNLPIVHSDLKRLMLASPLIDPADQMEMSILPYESVLNIHLYIKLEEELRDTEYLTMGLSPVEIERSHIFHKLIFDSLNEKLDYERIGGLKPILPTFFFSYKSEPKITPDYCAIILERSKKDVIEWSLERIGHLPENIRRDQFADEANDENIESLREEALVRHLNTHVITLEEKWQDYSDELLEVFLNLSDYIFDTLVEGVVTSLVSIKESKNKPIV